MKTLWNLILIAAFAAVTFIVTPVTFGAQLSKTDADVTYKLAQDVSHLPVPEEGPVVRLANKEDIEAILVKIGVCPKGCPSVKAAQIGNTVYVDGALDFTDPQNIGIFMHELFHYMQWARDGDAKTCDEWKNREISAYQWQNFFLNKLGARMVQSPAWPDCKSEK